MTAARAYRLLVGLISLLVLVQATLAGQFLYRDGDLKKAHEGIANGMSGLVLLLLLLGLVAWRKGQMGGRFAGYALFLLLLVVAQVGLGYVGREESAAAALHMPLGVALFGFATWLSIQTRAAARRR